MKTKNIFILLLVLVFSLSVLSFSASSLDKKGIVQIEDINLLTNNTENPTDQSEISYEKAKELLLKKYPDFIYSNPINLGSLGEYNLFYNVTEYYTFLDYDIVMGDYTFNVFQQQSPYDIGLYVIDDSKAYTLAEAYDSKLINIGDVYNLIKSNPQYDYNFRVSPTDNTEPTESVNPTTATPKLTKNHVSLKAGKTSKIGVKNKGNNKIEYKSSDTKIAKVDKNGKVTALKKGRANITVTVGNKNLTYKVTVTSNPELLLKGKTVTNITLNKNKSVSVKISGKANNIDNKYSNTECAKITSKKSAKTIKVKGIIKGTTTLKIKVNGVKTLKLKVKVK